MKAWRATAGICAGTAALVLATAAAPAVASTPALFDVHAPSGELVLEDVTSGRAAGWLTAHCGESAAAHLALINALTGPEDGALVSCGLGWAGVHPAAAA